MFCDTKAPWMQGIRCYQIVRPRLGTTVESVRAVLEDWIGALSTSVAERTSKYAKRRINHRNIFGVRTWAWTGQSDVVAERPEMATIANAAQLCTFKQQRRRPPAPLWGRNAVRAIGSETMPRSVVFGPS